MSPADKTTRSGSASVVSWVPGLNENEKEGGNDVYSAFPNKGSIWPPFLPIDEGFLGDQARQIGNSLQETLDMRKTVEDLSGLHRQYRVKNTVEVTFTATSNQTIDPDSPIEIKVNTRRPTTKGVVLDFGGQPKIVPVDLLNPDTPEPLSKTILEENVNEHVNASISDLWDVGDNERTRPAHARQRFLSGKYDTFSFRGSELEGIRISNLWGTENPYTRELARAGPDWLPGSNPIIYSWIDMVVLADGTHAVRIQDATQFPMHTLYTGPAGNPGEQYKRTDSGLEIKFDPSASTNGEYAAAVNEDHHKPWSQFAQSFDDNTTYVPYKTPKKRYLKNHNNNSTGRWFGFKNELLVDHPIMTYGQTNSGEELTREEVMEILPTPQSPYPELLSYFSN